jgi:phosphoglycolate phosphatase-like HAD superfamily hydrolase
VNIKKYRTLVFDCDGVILDSNRLKTEAFRAIAQPFGDNVAQGLVDFHLANTGASRYLKFSYLLEHLLNVQPTQAQVKILSDAFASRIANSLRICPVASGMDALRELVSAAGWMVVSGSDQSELRLLFSERKLDGYFDLGIYGSPDTKDEILKREIIGGSIKFPAVFLGDSRYDHEAAMRAGLDFIFISEWSQFEGWSEYVRAHHLSVVERLNSLNVS